MHYSPSIHARAAGLLIAVAVGLVACTGEEGSPGRRAAPARLSTAPVPSADGHGAEPGGDETRAARGPGDEVEITDRESRRVTNGAVPGYVEIEKASVRSDGDALLFAMRLAGEVPARTRAGTATRVTWRVLLAGGQELTVEAEGRATGWIATGTAGEETFPVTLGLGGDEVEMTVARDVVGVAPFRWNAGIAWVDGSSYGFDLAPESGYADFPG
jgi:hypothetical protein